MTDKKTSSRLAALNAGEEYGIKRSSSNMANNIKIQN